MLGNKCTVATTETLVGVDDFPFTLNLAFSLMEKE
jgi:hypothetical protein